MIRVLALVGGLGGAVTLSQFPEYSQQYLQRLAGAVDELSAVVAAFDASAEGFGLTRAEALDQMGGSAFQDQLRDDMAGNIARLERLSADYAALSGTAPLERLTMVWRLRDSELAARTWGDFRPAVPVTRDGALATGIGFGAGWLMVAGLLRGLLGLSRRRRTARADRSPGPVAVAAKTRGLREPPPVTRAAREAGAGLSHPAE